jgi:hypothetical protein
MIRVKKSQSYSSNYPTKNKSVIEKIERTYFYDNGISLIIRDGNEYWYQNDLLHRENGPAITYKGGSKYWYQNGSIHRENGPAIELSSGTKVWYQHGEYHRIDGPAVEYGDGAKEYWVHGVRVSNHPVNLDFKDGF